MKRDPTDAHDAATALAELAELEAATVRPPFGKTGAKPKRRPRLNTFAKGLAAESELLRVLTTHGVRARLPRYAEDATGDCTGVVAELVPGQPPQLLRTRAGYRGFTRVYRWLRDRFAVCFRGDRGEWLVTVRLDDLLNLLRGGRK